MKSSTLSNLSPLQTILIALVLFAICLGLLSTAIHLATLNNVLSGDFCIFWYAGRAIFINHQTPYTAQLNQQIQMAIMKRLATPQEDQLGFAYPPYALLAALPLFWFSFDWASPIWMAFNLLALISALILAFPKASKWLLGSVFLFYPMTFGIFLGNFAVLVGTIFFFVYGILITRKSSSAFLQAAAGALMAWATIKPQISWLFILFFLVYAFRKRKFPFIIAFGVALLALLAISFWIVPAWPQEWGQRLKDYSLYNHTWIVLIFYLKTLLPDALSIALSIPIFLLMAFETILLGRRWWQGKLGDIYMLAWIGLAAYLGHPYSKSYDQIPLIIPLAIWICTQTSRKSFAMWFFWVGSLVFSWLAFFFNTAFLNPLIILEVPYFVYLAWVIWMYIDLYNDNRSMPSFQNLKKAALP
ncbi:MAG: glycosyltransferase 87 family protein [Anaerolineaceae bacterium]|nr:glycosyltransferase 87 family protein [Anaerolineaceae bacterium]